MENARHCDVNASLYSGSLDVIFDCPGECDRAVAEVMEDGRMAEWCDCSFRENGSCGEPFARLAALKALREKIDREVVELDGTLKEAE